jgi:hypothetical protein
MKTVPLSGKKAAGRAALVDDEDYELVMQYRWHVYEVTKPGRRPSGPYAVANIGHGRSDRRTTRMHNLIMGRPYIDHADHNGLNNQRSNLRPASNSQNGANQRAQEGRSSEYKGVTRTRSRKAWRAVIKVHQKFREVGEFTSELEAAYAYDAAAREAFGEFACTNFPEGPTQIMLDQWQAEREVHEAAMTETRRACGAAVSKMWDSRQPETRICTECGGAYESRSTRSFYCSTRCRNQANYRTRQRYVQ